eukprot:149583-Chlamydomonas_euryale.AAC.1
MCISDLDVSGVELSSFEAFDIDCAYECAATPGCTYFVWNARTYVCSLRAEIMRPLDGAVGRTARVNAHKVWACEGGHRH